MSLMLLKTFGVKIPLTAVKLEDHPVPGTLELQYSIHSPSVKKCLNLWFVLIRFLKSYFQRRKQTIEFIYFCTSESGFALKQR